MSWGSVLSVLKLLAFGFWNSWTVRLPKWTLSDLASKHLKLEVYIYLNSSYQVSSRSASSRGNPDVQCTAFSPCTDHIDFTSGMLQKHRIEGCLFLLPNWALDSLDVIVFDALMDGGTAPCCCLMSLAAQIDSQQTNSQMLVKHQLFASLHCHLQCTSMSGATTTTNVSKCRWQNAWEPFNKSPPSPNLISAQEWWDVTSLALKPEACARICYDL